METDLAFADDGVVVSDCGAALLERYENSKREDHQHLCAVIGGTMQTLKDQGIGPTPVAYFAAIVASLESLSRDQGSASDPVAAGLIVFLSEVIYAVPNAVVISRRGFVADALLRFFGFGSLSEDAVAAGLKCLTRLITAEERVRWDSVSHMYGVLLGFVTDPRPRVRNKSKPLTLCFFVTFCVFGYQFMFWFLVLVAIEAMQLSILLFNKDSVVFFGLWSLFCSDFDLQSRFKTVFLVAYFLFCYLLQ